MALTKITSSGVGLVSATTVKTATNEEDALLVEQSDGTDVGALRINNGRFILSGKHSSNPVQIQTHDGNEDIEVDPDGFIKMETAGSERLRIDASGKVAIGSTNNGASGTIDLSVGSTSSSGGITLWSPTSGTHSLGFGDGYSGTDRYRGYLEYAHSDDSMRFATGATERMRITSAGKMGFGTSTQILNGGGALASFTFGGAQGVFISTVSQSGGECMGFVHQGSSVVGTIAITSSATSYNTSSDYRLKENVNYTWDATTRLKQLKPAQFNWIADDTNTLVDGFLAHEVSSVVPQAITKTKDAMTAEVLYEEGDELPDGKNIGDVKQESVPDYQGIDQSKLVPLLVKALQEQQVVIESLKTRITALEAE